MKFATDCENSTSMSRRRFLKAGAILSFAALPELAFGQAASDNRLLVILLRGGMDGLFAMPPVGDKSLQGLRRNLRPDGLLKLDGFFALHPALKNVHRMYQEGQALLVHGTSLPYTGRSHFEGQDIMESGIMRPYASASGWLGRALEVSGLSAALTMTLPVPLILRGERYVDTYYPTWIREMPKEAYRELMPIWATDPELADFAQQLTEATTKPSVSMGRLPGAENSIFDLALRAAVRLRKIDGPRVAVLDHVGFDTHSSQTGQHADRLRDVDLAIDAFQKAMGPVWKDTLVVTVTEFGRTAAENGSWGTDHGWGTSIFVLGGKLKRGGIVADWPGLKKNSLFEGRDLKSTIDARSLYGHIISTSFNIETDRVKKEVLDFELSHRFDEYI
jgi:uncharacterized protein (DUF1501 family)